MQTNKNMRMFVQMSFTLVLLVLFIVFFGYPAISKFFQNEVFIKVSTEPKVCKIFVEYCNKTLIAAGEGQHSEHSSTSRHLVWLRCVQCDISGDFYLSSEALYMSSVHCSNVSNFRDGKRHHLTIRILSSINVGTTTLKLSQRRFQTF